MNFDVVLSDLQSKKYKPVYFFHGEEDYYIDEIVDYMENHVLSEEAKAFNQSVLYGKDVDYKYLIDEARQFPLMSDKRLIIVKEAQEMKTLKEMADYVKKPVPHAIMVFAHKHKAFDKRTSLAKALNDQVIIESKKLYDNQVPAWILQYSKKINLGINDQIAQVLSEYLGNDLTKISNELDKLLISSGKGSKITLEIIQDQIGISREFNVFELQKALAEKNKTKSFVIAKYLAENTKENPLVTTTSNLFNYFVKVLIAVQGSKDGDQELQKKLGLTTVFFVKEYRLAARNYNHEKVREILQLIREVDLASKGLYNKSKDEAQLLKELVYNILN